MVAKDKGKKAGKDLAKRKNYKTRPGATAEVKNAGKTDQPKKALEKTGSSGHKRQTGSTANDRRKHPQGRLKKILLISGAVLTVLLAAAGIYLFTFYRQIQEPRRIVLDEGSYQEESFQNDIHAVFPEHIVNIGLLGFDRGWDRESRGHYMFRPDVQAVISIDFERDQISLIRIPRDSYVPLHGTGGFHDKINHAYQYGYYSGESEDSHIDGIRYTLLTISNLLGGVPIHYYVSVDMYSIIALIDAVGGIYYDIEEEIVDEVWEYGVILPPIPAGPQILDGKTYLRYLQYRDSKSLQDYGRIDRQSKLLRETYHYLRENNRLADIPLIYRVYKDYVDTDLSYKKIATLFNYALKVDLSDENLHFYTLKGSSQQKDGIWYEVISQDHRLEIIEKVFGISVEPWASIVLEDSEEYLKEQERERRLQDGGGLSPQIPDFDDLKLFNLIDDLAEVKFAVNQLCNGDDAQKWKN